MRGIANFDGIFPNAVFSRSSAAYLSDGTSVASGVPRYVNGRFNNLIPVPEKSDFEVSINVGGNWGSFTINRLLDTSNFVHGNSSLKSVVDGTIGNGGTNLFSMAEYIAVKPNTRYVYSMYIKSDRAMTFASLYANLLYVQEYNNRSLVIEKGYNSVKSIDDKWTRISATFVTSPNTSNIKLASYVYEPITVWVDCAQLEEAVLKDENNNWIPTQWRLGGTGKGILVEEGTTNLFTANRSNIETDISGLNSRNGATLTRDTTEKWEGNASLKVVTSGTVIQEGIEVLLSGTQPAGDYTYSIYVKGSGDIELVGIGSGITSSVGSFLTLSNAWQRMTGKMTIGGSGGTFVGIRIHTRSVQSATFFIDGLQFEAKPYATSWIPGGSTRAAETLTIPTTGLSPTQGTIEAWVYVNNEVKRSLSGVQPTLFVLRKGTTLGPWIWVFWASNGINLQVRKEDTTTSFANAVVPLADTPDGLHHIAVTYTGNSVRLYLNGVMRIDKQGVVMPVGYDRLNIGHREGTTLDTLGSYVDEFRVSSIVRSDAEILASYSATNPHVPDNYTQALLHFDNNLLSHEEVKAVLMPNGNLHIRGAKQIG